MIPLLKNSQFEKDRTDPLSGGKITLPSTLCDEYSVSLPEELADALNRTRIALIGEAIT